MMNYFKMLVSVNCCIQEFWNAYHATPWISGTSRYPIVPVSQGDFLHWSCSLYSWLNGCRNRTPAVISFNQSTVDFISGRKDPLFLSIGDNCCSSSQHSNIEVVVRQFMATTLNNLNYYIYKAQKLSRFVNGTYSVKIMYNETRCKRLKQAR